MLYSTDCPICLSDSVEVVRRQTGPDTYLSLVGLGDDVVREWLKCSNCGHVFNSAQLNKAELRTLYQRFRDQEWRNESPDEYFDRITSLPAGESENHQKVELLRSLLDLSRGGKLVDIGCGGGVLLHALRQQLPFNWNFWGVEPTLSYAALAARRSGAHVVCANYEKDVMEDAPFDAATCCQVLEHVPDPRGFLAAINKDLKPGGWLYVEVPDVSDFESLEPSHDRFMVQHVSYFSAPVLRRLLTEEGFDIIGGGVTQTVRGRNNLWFLAEAVLLSSSAR
jgi:2-polyprenyl-3-methyl-5-hydroxy-6-metoxy-1,4-benzoquinol methylase